MDKIVLNPVTNTNSLSAINQNFTALADELQDKVLYRDNPPTQPNAMNNSLDMDGNDIINVNTLAASAVLIDGVDISSVIEQEAGVAITASQAAANLSLQYSQYSQASAASASDSALTASTAASTIGTSVINAENFAIAAGVSALAASGSASNASASESNASTSEGNALAYKNSASLSATTASNAAISAGTSATTATTQAGLASGSATSAGASATTATTQAGIANTQAGVATTKADIATTKASDANNSAIAAQAAADSISGGPVTSVNTKTGVVVINKSDIGLSNVDNTSDSSKPVSTAQGAAISLKADIASPTFTGTVGGITKAMVGLSSVDNTTDAGKPVSTAQLSALNLKAPLASPTFTGAPLSTTPASSDNTTKIVTTAWAKLGLLFNIVGAGYINFPTWLSGLQIRWGTVVGTTDVFGVLVHSFPVSFNTNIFTCVATNGDSGATSGNITFQSFNYLGLVFRVFVGGTAAASTSVRINYIAIGY